MAQDEVGVKITADDSGLAPIDKAAERVKRFGAEAERAAKATEKAWKDASTAVGQSLLAVSASFAAGFTAMGREASKLETNLRNVNTMAKLNEKGFLGLRDSVIALSEKLKTKGPNELGAALYDIYGAGLKGASAMAVLEQAAIAADAGMTDTKTAGKALTAMMLAYRMPAEKAAYANNILFKSVELGKVSFEELAAVVPSVSTKAAAFGVSAEELGAILATLSLQTGSASEAATQFERAMLQLAAPTKESKKLFEAYHIDIGKTAIAKEGLVTILLKLTKAYAGADDKTREALSSVEAMQAALILTGDAGKGYAANLEQMGKAEGAAMAARQENMKAASKQWEIFLAAVETGAVKFGNEILPLASKGLQAATALVKRFTDLSPSARAFEVSAGVVTMGVTGVIGSLFLLAPQLAALPQAMANAATGARLLATSMSTGLIGAIGVATIAVAGLYAAWDRNFLGIRDITKQTVEDIQHTLTGLKQMAPMMFPGINDGLQDDTDGDRLRKLRGIGKGLKNDTGTKISFTSPSKVTAASFLAGENPYAKAAAEKKPGVDPNIQRLLDALAKAQKQNPVFDPNANPPKTPEKRAISEAEMRSYIGSKSDVYGDIGGLDKATLSSLYKTVQSSVLADFRLQITSGKREGTGGSFHNSGRAVDIQAARRPNNWNDQENPKMIQALAAGSGFKTGINEYRTDAAAVTGATGPHVHLTTGYEKQSIPGAFQVKGERNFSSAYEDIGKTLIEVRQKYLDFIGKTGDDTLAKLSELDKAYNEAKQGAFTPQEDSRLSAAYTSQRSFIKEEGAYSQEQEKQGLQNATIDLQGIGIDEAKKDYDQRMALIQAMGQANRAEIEQRRNLEIEVSAERIAQIRSELSETMADTEEAKARRDALVLDEATGVTRLAELKQAALNDERTAYEADLQYRREMGLITQQEYLTGLQFELQNMQLTEEQKRALLLQTHQAKLAMDQEASASADQITNSLEQSFGDMLTGALTKQNNFNQTFQSLWKSVANTIIAELAKMIVKALALQVIMRGIFGVFGGIFGGAASLAGADAAGSGLSLGGLATAHSGGMVVPGGVQSFHTGGGVGVNLRPDEVLAKLQVGEMVLSRQQVAGTSSGSTSGQRPFSPNITVHATVNNGYDVDSLGAELARSMDRHAQGAY